MRLCARSPTRNRTMNRPQKIADPDSVRPQFSDDALALRFAERYGNELRYVAKWSQWLRWTGTRWLRDDTLAAFDRARLICREATWECNEQKVAKELASKDGRRR